MLSLAPEAQEIPISEIDVEKFRLDPPNSYDSKFEDLTESLLLHGQLSPILVRLKDDCTGRYEIIFGNRRLDAAKKLGWKTIKAQVANISKSEALVLAFVENSDRNDFSDYERALLLQKMHDTTGRNYKEIAKLVGRSPSFVAQHIAMIHLFSDDCASVEERERVLSSITEGHARVLARIRDPIDRWNTAKLAVASNMGVRELARMSFSREKSSSGFCRTRRVQPTVPMLIKDILNGTTGKDLRPLSRSMCPKHFTMFSSFRTDRRMEFEEALDHFSQTARKVDAWNQQIEDLSIRTVGNFSYATLIIKHRMKSGGKNLKAKTRLTLIFERESGIWKCAHGHWSSVDSSEQIPSWIIRQ
jgi:ParB/RepB/Spo0J family partition protein